MDGPVKRAFPAAGIILGLVFLSRLAVLHRSVLDWDESLYFLMARAWHTGHLPYTTIWDNKPLGIYAIFAVFQSFVPGVAAMRVATVACVSLLAFTVLNITEQLTRSRAAGWVAAAALMLASLSNDGLSANTELFMASFTALAVWGVLAGVPAAWIGLALGAAFMVKYVAVFEAAVVFFWLLARRPRLATAAWALAGGALPLALVVVLYAAQGELKLWLECSVLANLRRAAVPLGMGALDYALRIEVVRWGTLYAGGLAMILAAGLRRGEAIFLSAWLLAGLLGAASAKSFYDHYFLQVLPVLCVILGVWFSRLPASRQIRAVFIIAALALPACAGLRALQAATVPDVTAQIGQALKHQPGSLYVFDGQPILYALADKPAPTRFVLPSELTGRLLPRVAGVDAAAEVARILAAKPDFIVRRTPPQSGNPAVDAELEAALRGYALWRQYPGMAVYRLNSGR